MVNHHKIFGYEEFCKFVSTYKSKEEPVFYLFTGSKLESGESWCSDCIEAEPAIEAALKSAPENSHFVTVFVGDRATWKDLNCKFRTDLKTRLLVIPTIIRWGTVMKLDGENCKKQELVEMLFNEEDD